MKSQLNIFRANLSLLFLNEIKRHVTSPSFVMSRFYSLFSESRPRSRRGVPKEKMYKTRSKIERSI